MITKKTSFLIASCLLIFMGVVAIFSMKGDSLTMDEVAHLPAGYSYLTQKDMRLNPEHPPLIKDLAGFPLLFIKGVKFPSEIKDWKEDVNGQWGFGFHFLYHTGNPADKMIFWGRIPMILLMLFLGLFIFFVARELFGERAGLLALFLYSFSPTFLAHGRLVTTDVGASAGVFIPSYFFIKALKNPTKKNIILSGITFGLGELCKFSVILLVPFYLFLGGVWWILKMGRLKEVLKVLVLTAIIGFLIIGIFYQYHVWNYPPQRQARDTEVLLGSTPYPIVREILVWSATKPILRAFAQYFLGLSLVFQRAAGGHTTYFLGEISAAGWKNYFPVVYTIKLPLAFHILTLIALFYCCGWLIKAPFWVRPIERLKEWIRSHFMIFAMLCFIFLYWGVALKSNLNIGVRHLLPTLPFTMVLVSGGISKFLENGRFEKLKYGVIGGLLLWQAFSFISIYPHYLSYFNEIIGGPKNGYLYTVDSNLDWGQDLKRLKKWVEEKKIDKIFVDYFGGGDAKYYLKEKFRPWWGTRDPREFPKNNYLAVSVTFLQGGRGNPAPGFDQPWGYYLWLDNYKPIAKIGYSIFVYYIK